MPKTVVGLSRVIVYYNVFTSARMIRIICSLIFISTPVSDVINLSKVFISNRPGRLLLNVKAVSLCRLVKLFAIPKCRFQWRKGAWKYNSWSISLVQVWYYIYIDHSICILQASDSSHFDCYIYLGTRTIITFTC